MSDLSRALNDSSYGAPTFGSAAHVAVQKNRCASVTFDFSGARGVPLISSMSIRRRMLPSQPAEAKSAPNPDAAPGNDRNPAFQRIEAGPRDFPIVFDCILRRSPLLRTSLDFMI